MLSVSRRAFVKLGLAGSAVLGGASLLGCSPSLEAPGRDGIDAPSSNMNRSGMPIVKDPITIRMMTGRAPNAAEDFNQVASMKRMQELSGIVVDWGLVPNQAVVERRNLALASGDYPEVLHRTSLGAVDIVKFGEAGTFLALGDVVEEYMPNLKRLLDSDETLRKGLTFPDGQIYSLPTIYDTNFDALIMGPKLWVRKDWLDRLGLDVPETVEEFVQFLTRAKSLPVAGANVVPFTSNSLAACLDVFRAPFQLGLNGQSAGFVDSLDGSSIRFWPGSEGFRDLLAYMRELYANGLIQADIFSTDVAKFNGLGKQGVVAACVTQAPTAVFGPEVGSRYVPCPPLKRSSSDPVPAWPLVASGLASIGGFVVTDRAEHPIEACRWMDYFYGTEGAELFFMGIEGQSFRRTVDGQVEFLPSITDNADGLTVDEALRPYVTYLGGGYPGVVLERFFKGTESSPQAKAGAAVLAPHKIDDVWSPFTFSGTEAGELGPISADISKLVEESRAKFVSGEIASSSWPTYVGQLEQVGLAKFVAIQQAALDRFRQ